MWAVLHRKHHISAIVDESGQAVASTPAEISAQLGMHWMPTFSWKAIDHDAAFSLLDSLPHDKQWCWHAVPRPSQFNFKKTIEHRVDSGVGPDGLPYSAYDADKETSSRMFLGLLNLFVIFVWVLGI